MTEPRHTLWQDPQSGAWRVVPVYDWSLDAGSWVYENPDILRAIEQSLDQMQVFPDAEQIITDIKENSHD